MTARAKSAQGNASAILADGNLRSIPGFGTVSESRALDEIPMMLNLGVITFTSAAQTGLGNRPCIPFKSRLVGLSYTVLTQAATTAMLWNLGTSVSSAKLITGTSVNNGAAGTFVNVDLTGLTTLDLNAGDVLAVGASATAGAVISMMALIVPRA